VRTVTVTRQCRHVTPGGSWRDPRGPGCRMHRRRADAGTPGELDRATLHQLRAPARLQDVGACRRDHDAAHAPGHRCRNDRTVCSQRSGNRSPGRASARVGRALSGSIDLTDRALVTAGLPPSAAEVDPAWDVSTSTKASKPRAACRLPSHSRRATSCAGSNAIPRHSCVY
jgi:hypothetical protein